MEGSIGGAVEGFVCGAKRTREAEVNDEGDGDLVSCSKRCTSSAAKQDIESSGITGDTSIVTSFIRPHHDLNVLYYPRFIPGSEANRIFKQLKTELLVPYLGTGHIKMAGQTISIPRKQTAFGDSGLSYTFSGVTVYCNPWLPLVRELKTAVEIAAQETFNFVLVNYYRNGLDYIGEHRDDETDLCSKSSIASMTFGCERDFVFRHSASRGKNATRKDIESVKISLSNGSLLLMKDPTNKMWYHSLPVRKNCHGVRINLTFRNMKHKL